HHVPVCLRVAVRDPAFAVGSYTCVVVIIPATPDRIRMHHPERRRPRSRRQIDKEIRLHRSKLPNQMNHCREITVKPTPLEDRISVPRPIKLELIHSVLLNHLQRDFLECLVVLRPRKRIPAAHDLVSRTPSKRNSLLLWLRVPTPRRHPNTRISSILFRRLFKWSKPIRKPAVEVPERVVPIPSVVKQK